MKRSALGRPVGRIGGEVGTHGMGFCVNVETSC